MTQTIAPRDPNTVMTLARMGCFHQSRLSFMRVLLRRLRAERWTFTRPVFEIDGKGVGHAVYTAHGPDHSYSLVAFANDLPPEKRSDRVIATEWDATFTLFDGVPSQADIDMTQQVADAAKSMGILLHDHLIMAKSGHTSFRDLGYL